MNDNGGGEPERLSLLSWRQLVEDAIRRNVNREGDRAIRAAKSTQALQHWAAAFYTDGETAATAAVLEPVIQLTGVAGARAMAMRLARDLREEHQQHVADLVRRAPADLKASMTRLVEIWQKNDPRRFADVFVARANVGKSLTVTASEEDRNDG